jgi:hypothetical protein
METALIVLPEKMISQHAPHEYETGVMVPQKMIDMTTFSVSVRLPCPAFSARCAPKISQIVHHSVIYVAQHKTKECLNITDQILSYAKRR